MGLAELFQQLASDMLTPGGIFDNVPIEATYYSGAVGESSTYDPATQVVIDNETAYAVFGVPDKINYRMVDNVNVFPNDKLFYVAGNIFKNAGLTTRNKPGDRIVFSGESWSVVKIDTDPVEAVFIIHVRKP